MKRVGHRFDVLTDARTLTAAAWRAARGKRLRPEVRAFLSRIEYETARLGRELRAQTFRFSEYRCFRIRDPKTRTIHAPPFRDRVTHHAIVSVTASVFERGAIEHSYACRPARGQHAALRRVRRWMRPEDRFLKIDLARYYDSVDHERLRVRLARRFRERRLLALFDRLLDSYATDSGKGLPIGALTSQYLGNFFLDPIDHWIGQELGVGGIDLGDFGIGTETPVFGFSIASTGADFFGQVLGAACFSGRVLGSATRATHSSNASRSAASRRTSP